jgi:hypothetical protein
LELTSDAGEKIVLGLGGVQVVGMEGAEYFGENMVIELYLCRTFDSMCTLRFGH